MPNSGMSLEDISKSLALTTLQYQQDTRANLQETRESIQLLGNQISQLDMTIDKIAIQASQELTSQTDANPIKNVSATTLQSGKELRTIEHAPTEAKEDEKTLKDTEEQNKKVESNLIPPPLSNTCAHSFSYKMPNQRMMRKKF
ncbi:UNVERIFIED_CONTAM: hypothetical protein Slati_3412300 [Sesamum latifolium]|uniref:Uncharacterized protein n=1 Tax=Sesamum latifolium TaxID=2727402 RepID=A0AAW2UFS0_9LAMI